MTQLENERLARVEEKVDTILKTLENLSNENKDNEKGQADLKTRIVVLETQLKIAWIFISMFLVYIAFPWLQRLIGVR
jgi:hypothetical protein